MATLALLLLGGTAEAQNSDALKRKYESKLTEAFVGKINWAHSLEEAKKRARAEGKPILGYFTRSYSP